MGLWVRGERIIHGLYENRPAQILLRQIAAATEYAHERPCAGLADVSTGRAQVLVLSRVYAAAQQELGRSEEILSQLPPDVTGNTGSVMGWGEPQLRYTEAWVHAYAGDESKTDQAARRALQLYPHGDTRSPAQIKLMQAFARIRSGDISEGIRHAHTVYEPLQTEQHTTMIGALARQILQSVPPQDRRRPDVISYRELMRNPDRKMITS